MSNELAHHITVYVPYCACYRPFINECMDSLESQDFSNFTVVVINDGDDDITLFHPYLRRNRRWSVRSFKTNRGPAFTKWQMVRHAQAELKARRATPNDIFMIVDGDDYLCDTAALRTISDTYTKTKCWMSYGSFVGKWCEQTVDIDRKKARFDFKKEAWRYGHPRTFKTHLAEHFREEDFQDEGGEWFRKCTDRLLVYNALQWCGVSRVAYIDAPIYFYRDHGLNLHKTVQKKENDRYLADVQARPSKAALKPTVHIVMCCWKRAHVLADQLRSLSAQTLASRMHLHLLNNNAAMQAEFERIVDECCRESTLKVTLSHFDNAHFGFERFLYVRDRLIPSCLLDYCIMIDDDQQFNDARWIERLWSTKAPCTYLSWYCKAWKPRRDGQQLDYWAGSSIGYRECYNGLTPSGSPARFHYGGTGGSVVDAAIFLPASSLFRLERCRLSVLNLEDLWLSFVVTHLYSWQIRRSYVVPDQFEDDKATDACALWTTLWDEKNALLNYLVGELKWKLE
jgi:glycosyltransferase involved in cell wall biosynthesis